MIRETIACGVAVAAIALTAQQSAGAERASVVLKSQYCVRTIKFDPKRHSEEEIRRIALYAPGNGSQMLRIKHAMTQDPKLEHLASTLPAEMKPYTNCLQSIGAFDLDTIRNSNAYVETGELRYLQEPILGIDPREVCSKLLAGAKESSRWSRNDRIVLKGEWTRSMQKEFKKHQCDVLDRWKKFLKEADIEDNNECSD